MEMADGIEVEDLPQFITRSELMKKVMSRVTVPALTLCCVVLRTLVSHFLTVGLNLFITRQQLSMIDYALLVE